MTGARLPTPVAIVLIMVGVLTLAAAVVLAHRTWAYAVERAELVAQQAAELTQARTQLAEVVAREQAVASTAVPQDRQTAESVEDVALDATRRASVPSSSQESQSLIARSLSGASDRLQNPLRRMVPLMDQLYRHVEDPAAQKPLYKLDHLIAQTLRFSETLGVLGGQSVERNARRVVPVRALALTAFSEIPRYRQAEQGRMDDIHIVSSAHGDLRHALAELVDNATKSSDPSARPVVVKAGVVNAGLKITVEDHGRPPAAEDYDRHNAVLAGQIDLCALVMSKQYGLAAVAKICEHRGWRAWLEPNRNGSTDAHVIVPHQWLATATETKQLPTTAGVEFPRRTRQQPAATQPPAEHQPGPAQPTTRQPTAGAETAAESTMPHEIVAPPATTDSPNADAEPVPPPLPQRIRGASTHPAPHTSSPPWGTPSVSSVDPVQLGALDDILGHTRTPPPSSWFFPSSDSQE